jgi:hypothetical protein
MLQLKKRKDSSRGVRFMATICFYQDSRHAEDLHWIRKVLGCGYIAVRNDGMTELRINSFGQVYEVLGLLLPYIRFKKIQAKALRNACAILMAKTFRTLSATDIQKIVSAILVIQQENYQSRNKKTKEEYYASLGLTP